MSYLGTKSPCNVCRKFLRIFCSPPVALLPSCQLGADGAFHSWDCSTPPCRKSAPSPGTPAPSGPSFCAFHFCAKMAVMSLKSKYMSRESCGSHYHQANVYAHSGTDSVLVVMCRAVWFVN